MKLHTFLRVGDLKLMLDFAERVAASKEFPSLLFGFEPLDPAVRKHDATTPECVKLAVV
jgi:hypothetical protein